MVVFSFTFVCSLVIHLSDLVCAFIRMAARRSPAVEIYSDVDGVVFNIAFCGENTLGVRERASGSTIVCHFRIHTACTLIFVGGNISNIFFMLGILFFPIARRMRLVGTI